MKKIIFVLLFTLLLTGCGTGVSVAEKHYQDVSPQIVEIGDTRTNDGYCYAVDKNTGVVYLEYDGPRRFGITIMLNPDGTPVTAEQLGIEY